MKPNKPPHRLMPAAKPMPIDAISQLVTPDFERGKLVWNPRAARPPHLSEEWAAWWNGQYAGKDVGVSARVYGGEKVRLGGRLYYIHRVLFAMAHGFEPEQIDHIDGNRSNNAISNLAASSYRQNTRNKAGYRNNAAGHPNIAVERGKWTVRFKVNGVGKRFGYFDTLEEAIARRDAVKLELGFHPNHGRAA